MKKLFILVALLALVASTAFAQEVEKKWNVYLGAGAGMPMGDFGDAYKMGFHGFGGFGYTVTPGLQIMPTLEYHMFSLSDDGKAAWGTDVSGGTVKALMFGANLKYTFKMTNPSFAPYLIGGAGMASMSMSDITYDGTTESVDSESKAYFGAGAGVEIKAGAKMGIFVQVRYLSISTEGSSSNLVPVTVGVKF